MVDKDKNNGIPIGKTGIPATKQVKLRYTTWEVLVYLAKERGTSIDEVVYQLIIDAGLKSPKIINKILDKI